jgi:hypothetical protein
VRILEVAAADARSVKRTPLMNRTIGYRIIAISWVTLACAHTRVERQLQPDHEFAVQVGREEALIVFPPDSGADFPWPAQALTDRFAGPFWNVLTGKPGLPAISAAAQLGSTDALTLPAFPTLAAVISRTRLYGCELDTHVITCNRPLKGAISVDGSRVLMRITDSLWVQQLNEQRPDSAWLRVDRPNRRSLLSSRVPIRYRSGTGGA